VGEIISYGEGAKFFANVSGAVTKVAAVMAPDPNKKFRREIFILSVMLISSLKYLDG
jgi:hypothetical protein